MDDTKMRCRSIKKLVPVIFSAFALVACSAETMTENPETEKPVTETPVTEVPGTEQPTQSRKLLTDIQFESASLAQCVSAAAQAGNLQYVHELKVLSCNENWPFIHDTLLDGCTGEKAVCGTNGLQELTALEVLDLSGNLITAVDLRPLKNLQSLAITGNVIQQLDLSQNHALKTLDLSCNPLAKLTLAKNNAVETLKYWGGSCAHPTDFRPIDPFGPTPATFVDQVNGGLITEQDYLQTYKGAWLHLAELKNLVELNLQKMDLPVFSFADLPADNKVKKVHIVESGMTQLDITNLAALEVINVSYNKLAAFNGSNSQKLTTVNIAYNAIDDRGYLKLSGSVEDIDTTYNGVNALLPVSPGVKRLTAKGHFDGADLLPLTGLEELSIDDGEMTGNTLAAAGLKKLSLHQIKVAQLDLSASPNLTKISLKDNNLGQITFGSPTAIANIVRLAIGNNNLTNLDLRDAANLEHLVIDKNKLQSLDLTQATKLAAFSLGENPLLPEALLLPSSLKELDLRSLSWTSLALLNAPWLESLTATQVALTEIDLGKFPQLNNLRLANIPLNSLDLSLAPKLNNLSLESIHTETFDLTPMADMTGDLYINNYIVRTLTAPEFPNARSVNISIFAS